jgi:hypothetical protein
MTGAEISKQCVCGGSLAIPSIGHQTEDGYEACPECTKLFPHVLNEAGDACIYCGMLFPDGPCPSADHPNLTKHLCCEYHASGGSLSNSCGGDIVKQASA